MFIVSPSKIVQKIFPKYIWSIPNSENKIYLTFDDGPIPKITPWVLEQLKKYNAKATFFCLGNNVKKYPDIYKEILEQGHSVGNHSFSHLKGYSTYTDKYVSDFREANKLINSKLYRPPYGRITKGQANKIMKTHKIIMWNVLSVDYDSRISSRLCFFNVKIFTKSGSIIVFHDSKKAEKNMKYALQASLEYFSEKLFVFDKINTKF